MAGKSIISFKTEDDNLICNNRVAETNKRSQTQHFCCVCVLHSVSRASQQFSFSFLSCSFRQCAFVCVCLCVCVMYVRVCVLPEGRRHDGCEFLLLCPRYWTTHALNLSSLVRAASIRCRCLYFPSHKCRRRHFETSFSLVIACMKLCFLRALNRFYLICHFCRGTATCLASTHIFHDIKKNNKKKKTHLVTVVANVFWTSRDYNKQLFSETSCRCGGCRSAKIKILSGTRCQSLQPLDM